MVPVSYTHLDVYKRQAKGQGDDIIIRTIETNRLYGGLSERIETVRGINLSLIHI